MDSGSGIEECKRALAVEEDVDVLTLLLKLPLDEGDIEVLAKRLPGLVSHPKLLRRGVKRLITLLPKPMDVMPHVLPLLDHETVQHRLAATPEKLVSSLCTYFKRHVELLVLA
jgi:hypothetical protein